MREAAILTAHLLRLRRRSLATWTLSVTAYVLVIILVYTSIGDIDFNQLMSQYPEEVKSFFGGESLDFSTPMGYLNAELFSLMVPLALAFLPITIASNALAAAEDQRHQDVLLGAPVPRWSLLLAVLAASAVSLAVLLAFLAVVSVLFAWAVGVDLGFAEFAEACAGVWPLALFYGAIAILTAAITPPPRAHGGPRHRRADRDVSRQRPRALGGRARQSQRHIHLQLLHGLDPRRHRRRAGPADDRRRVRIGSRGDSPFRPPRPERLKAVDRAGQCVTALSSRWVPTLRLTR